MADLETVRQKLAEQITESGLTFRQISLKIGRKDSYIQQYIRYGFPKRLSEIDRRRVCRILHMNEKELIDDELITSGIARPTKLSMIDSLDNPTDYVMIDIYAPSLNTKLHDSVVGRIALNRKDFPDWCGPRPQKLRILRIEGDYMEPALPAGSMVLYDADTGEFRGDGIYIITVNNLAQAKRIQQTGKNTFILINDNPNYKEMTCKKEDFIIHGRAVSSIVSRRL